MVKRPKAHDGVPTILVKMPPASESDPRSARIRRTLKENLEFAFPGHEFQFVPETIADRQFTVTRSDDSEGGNSTDLHQIQFAVKRIATAMMLGTVKGPRPPYG
jgi:hypothetical protein